MALSSQDHYNGRMRAVVYRQYGPPEVLHLADLPRPTPNADEVLIHVRAAEATKADCELRSFQFAVKWFWLPLRIALGWRRPKRPVLGGYLSGDIVAVGESVSKFKPGDTVFGSAQLRMGAYGEYVCLPASYTLLAKPENLSFAEAAAVPLGGLNALHFMNEACVSEGDHVLVNGAGGSIGTFGVQIAKARGARVTAVDSALKEAMLREVGADHFIDYQKQDFTRAGQKYDVIFDMVAGSSYSGCMRCLRPAGRYVKGNPRLSDMFRCVLTSTFTKKTASCAFAGEREDELLTLKQMLEEGVIRPILDQVYPLAQAAEAHRRVETEQRLGIVVLSADSA